MDIERMQAACLAEPGAWPDSSWGHQHPVVKVGPGERIGRSGWDDLAFGGAIPDDELLEAVDESYRIVVGGLPKRLRPEGWDS